MRPALSHIIQFVRFVVVSCGLVRVAWFVAHLERGQYVRPSVPGRLRPRGVLVSLLPLPPRGLGGAPLSFCVNALMTSVNKGQGALKGAEIIGLTHQIYNDDCRSNAFN